MPSVPQPPSGSAAAGHLATQPPASEKLLTCLDCGEAQGPVSMSRSFRCNPCNSLKTRLLRVTGRDPRAENAFKCMSKTEKQAWFCENHASMGPEIAASLSEVAKHTETTEKKNTFKGNGLFFDREDLETKYKDKPTQLAAIFKNARFFECPIRETTLWEDVDYAAGTSFEDSVKDSSESTVTQERTAKKAKADGAQKAKPKQNEDNGPKPMLPSVKTKLEKFASDCTKWDTELDTLQKSVTVELTTFIAPIAVTSAQILQLDIQTLIAEVAGALDGNEFVMADIKKHYDTVKGDIKDVCRHLDDQLKDAEGFAAAAKEGSRFSKKRAIKVARAAADSSAPVAKKQKKAKAKAKK